MEVLIVSHPGIGPQLQVDRIPHLQQQRSPIGGFYILARLVTVCNDHVFVIFIERGPCRGRCMAIPKQKEQKVVDPSDRGSEDP